MTVPTPIDLVADMLGGAGYRRITTPFEIAGLKFDFPAAFIGISPSPDLILVADTAFDDEKRILQRVAGIARALDVMRSKRPLTAVLVGPRPSYPVIEAMSKVCRVLPVEIVPDGDLESILRNWLAVLMPLRLPEVNASIADPLNEIAKQLEGLEEVAELVELAPQGTEVVESGLLDIIAEPLADADLDNAQ